MTPEEKKKVLKHINSLEGPKRWLYARQILHKLNAYARYEHNETVKEVNELRNAQFKDTGASLSGDMRHGLSLPQSFLTTLQMVDPVFYHRWTKGDKAEQKACLRKLMRVFPEYSPAKKV